MSATLNLSRDERTSLEDAFVVLERISASDVREVDALAAGTAALIRRLLTIATAIAKAA